MQNFPEVQLAVTALKARFDAESGFASGDEPIGLILGTGLSGLGEDVRKAGEEKFRAVKDAYDFLKRERNIR